MAEHAPAPELKQALYELHRYLSDQLAPMMVADSIELLLRCPAQLVAVEIEGWVARQHRAADSAPISDYLFHALKKIHMMSEFDLIDPEPVKAFVQQLGVAVVEFCPEEDREALRQNVGLLGHAQYADASPVELLHKGRPPASTSARSVEVANAGALAPEIARSLKRFSLLLQRMELRTGSGDAAGDVRSQLLAAAAVGSSSSADFEQHLERLRELGIEAGTDQVFRALGRSLPGWILPPATATSAAQGLLPQNQQVEAMHRIITTADAEEGTKRFSEMLWAAIEQFNEGHLVQAVTMIELAERIIAENKLNINVVQSVQRRAHESLVEDRLRVFAEQVDKHDYLRRVLGFFPALSPKGLLDSLDGEPRRERRKLLLALLEVHGQAARSAALERLETILGTTRDPEGYFCRNLVFLLRRTPLAGEPIRRELELLLQLCEPGTPLLVIKEVISTLGLLKDPAAEQALITRLGECESMLLPGGPAALGNVEELHGLLDRAAASLVQQGTRRALETVIDHAFKKQPTLGDTLARLEKLGGRDLSEYGELVDRLTHALRNELPRKVLGFVVNKGKNDGPRNLIQALAGTPTPAVRQLLEEIVERFPEHGFCQAASRALSGFGAKTKPGDLATSSLSGDVELFGLPNLFQTLADSRVTGQLILSDREGAATGTVTFDEGRIGQCQNGPLHGEAAFYQLFEKPVPGSFVFRRQAAAPQVPGRPEPLEVIPAILEALRRHDEFQQARTLVPDRATLKPTGAKPSCPEETDLALLRDVWLKASNGTSPADCEASLAVDAYEVRRLYAQWVEEGVLEIR